MSVAKDVMKDMESNSTMTPCLRFSPLSKAEEMSQRINMGIEAVRDNTNVPAQADLSQVKAAAAETAKKATEIKDEEETIELAKALDKWSNSATEWLDKNVDDKVDHINDVGLGGLGVEALDKKFNIKENNIVQELTKVSDWAQS